MIYFLVYLFLEISVSIPVFSSLGVLGTFGEIILSAFLGLFLMSNSHYTLGESFNALRENKISPMMFQSISLLSVLGSILLVFPGVLTDIVGILFQFGFIATLVAKFSKNDNKDFKNQDDIIDVEVIEQSDTKDKR